MRYKVTIERAYLKVEVTQSETPGEAKELLIRIRGTLEGNRRGREANDRSNPGSSAADLIDEAARFAGVGHLDEREGVPLAFKRAAYRDLPYRAEPGTVGDERRPQFRFGHTLYIDPQHVPSLAHVVNARVIRHVYIRCRSSKTRTKPESY